MGPIFISSCPGDESFNEAIIFPTSSVVTGLRNKEFNWRSIEYCSGEPFIFFQMFELM